MIRREWPAIFVVTARFVGQISLNIYAIDGLAFIEEISNGKAIFVEPFGVTDLGLFTDLCFGA